MITINAAKYNLDITGATDNTAQFQSMINSFSTGSDLLIPAGTYKINGTINLTGLIIQAQNNVNFIGNVTNDLFNTCSGSTLSGLGFQNCKNAIDINGVTNVTVYNCKFSNNIVYSGVNIYNSNSVFINNNTFNNILLNGIAVNGNSTGIDILYNNFSNPAVYAGYTTAQICAHVYCLSGNEITVSNNVCNNNGGEGIIFCYNSTTGAGVTNSIIINNTCEGNGQEGITVYGGTTKLTNGITVSGNTCINNRYDQLEIWQTNNNIVIGNTVQESIAGVGNLAALCLYATTGTTCTGNTVLSANSNGISIIAGTSSTVVSNNIIANTNMAGDTTTPQKGNGILLDWDGVADPTYITIDNNIISSSVGTIAKSGVYSTSNTDHNNTISGNVISGYEFGVNPYALATCAT